MIPVVKLDEVIASLGERTGYNLLDEEQGCVNGSRRGILQGILVSCGDIVLIRNRGV